MSAMNSHVFNINQTIQLNDKRTFKKVKSTYNGKRKEHDL